MKIVKKIFITFLLLFVVLLFGCDGRDFSNQKRNLLLHLTFDDKEGSIARDYSNSKERLDGKINYVFNDAKYMPSRDPEWREKGVKGGCILFDGYSNYIKYEYNDIKISGSSLSISVWVAPRMFEWDDPNAINNGTERLTTIVGQYYKRDNSGFILGYQRHGAWSFQVGIKDRWLSLWDNDHPLKKYEWNHIAAVFDGENGQMMIYLNGELVNKLEFFEGAKIALAYDEPLFIGKNAYPDSNATASCNMLSGMIDDFRMYKGVLSAKSIEDYYKNSNVTSIDYEDISLQNILTNDYTKTQYHGGPYQHWMNEPHAPIYYNGKYHLFFQQNITGPYWRNICWGHLVSDDLVNWKQLKEVITPMKDSVCPDGIWSGGATYDKNGVPLLFFTAGNDSYSNDGLISNQNIGCAYPKDLNDPELTEWIVYDSLAIIQKNGQGRRGEFRDCHIWQEDGKWYMVIGSGSTTSLTGTALLYVSDKLELLNDNRIDMNWVYKGPIYEINKQPGFLGRVWELPVILPIYNENKTIKKYLFCISPAPADSADNKIYYFLGDFDKETGKFIPDDDFKMPHLIDYGANVFTGPSGFIDPITNEAYIFSIMQDQRGPSEVADSGWAHCVGLVRHVWLKEDGSDIFVEATQNLNNYQEILYSANNKTIEDVNNNIKSINKDLVYIKITFENINAKSFGIRIKKNDSLTDLTTFYYDIDTSTIVATTLDSGKNASSSKVSGNLNIINNKLTMEIYIDRSLVEAFFNKEKAISLRSYSGKDSNYIELFSNGGDVIINDIYIGEMESIYE